MKISRQGAISLLEVLVAITIIGILAALLASSYLSAVRASKATVCISNLRQVHAALQMYRQDYGEYPWSDYMFPPFQDYLGTRLKCPLYVQPPRDKDFGDYTLNTFLPDSIPLPDVKPKMECRALRGADWPLALDRNHASAYVAPKTRAPFYLILRESGAVNRIPWGRVVEMDRQLLIRETSSWPCPDWHSAVDNL
ncbi:MAG: hypothetical protein KatS3mg015_0500 [Fimbriimonadales bacterium]|nr:MAG: hypothetical protein KatS3mg015_0500 [Fimbriimonadales bacterium]